MTGELDNRVRHAFSGAKDNLSSNQLLPDDMALIYRLARNTEQRLHIELFPYKLFR